MWSSLSGNQKKLLAIGAANFLVLLCFGLYSWKSRLVLEGASDIINLCNHHFFRIPMMRLSCILNKFFPLGAVWLSAPLKVVAVSYLLNDSFLYLFISGICFFYLKDAKAAFLVFIINLFLMKSNYFLPGQELLFTPALSVLFFSVYQSSINHRIKLFAELLILVFIVWSHPLALPAFLAAAVFVHIAESSFHRKSVFIWAAFIAGNLLLRFIFISRYDRDRISELFASNTIVENFIATDFLREYFFSFPIIILLLILIIVKTVYEKNHRQLFYFILIIIPLQILFLSISILKGTAINQWDFAKTLLPVHFVILYAGLSIVFSEIKKASTIKGTAVALVIVFFSVSEYYKLYKISFQFNNHVAYLEKIIERCNTGSGSKFFIKEENTIEEDPMTTRFHYETIFYSALKGPQKAIQIIRATNEEIKTLKPLDEKDFYISENWIITVDEFDNNYFKMKPSRYTEVNLNAP